MRHCGKRMIHRAWSDGESLLQAATRYNPRKLKINESDWTGSKSSGGAQWK